MRQAERRARTIAALVAAARPLLASAGYAGTTLDAIAAAAGLSKGAVYAHLSRKIELYLLVVAQTLAQALAATEAAAEVAAAGNPARRVVGRYLGRVDTEHAALVTDLWQVAMQEPLVREALEAFRRERLARLARAFVDAGSLPRLAAEQAETVAALVDAALLDARLGLRAAAS